ncbi:MAG TPA: hypothetical protein VIH86_10155 [Puia sp.]
MALSTTPSKNVTDIKPTAELIKVIDSSPATSFTNEEREYLDWQVQHEIKREYLTTLRNNNSERIKYAKISFYFTCGWIFLVLFILLLCGSKVLVLSDSVLITLLTTTTANAFGFFFVVIKYLFNAPSPPPNN